MLSKLETQEIQWRNSAKYEGLRTWGRTGRGAADGVNLSPGTGEDDTRQLKQ